MMSSNLTAPAPAIRESEALKQLIRRLEEMFQLDRGDLDFGIYRIMNFRRDEILRFLRSELPARAEEAVRAAGIGDGAAALRRELDKAIAGAREAGFDPEASPRVRELRADIARAGNTAPDTLLDQIWTALDRFFGRYYDEGDFIAQRRGRDGVYLIPYEGEEVKLHWANKDQYYVKSSESFANYVFRLEDGRAVRFRVVSAETERDNNKEAKGKQRRFRLAGDQPLAEEDGDLIVHFTYQADEDDKRRQDALNADTAERILALPEAAGWAAGLAAPAPTEKDDKRRLIDKHLTIFTAKNSFDYFIHKDLKGFLARELDLFLDREVLNRRALNEARRANRMEQIAAELAKAEAVERIATEVIEFLAQIEEFQKRLWLKKKFVLDTQWCLTLDRIDAKFYPEIAASEAQRREWVELFAIDEIRAERLGDVAYSEPLTEAFLRANPFLVLDTKHFDEDFKARLLASIDDLDDRMDGLLVHSENFGALNLTSARFRSRVDCIYIDPPYNTGSDDFVYKDSYQHSSWSSMLMDRVLLASNMLKANAPIFTSISDDECYNLQKLYETILGSNSFVANVIWVKNFSPKNTARHFSVDHDYILVNSMNKDNWTPTLLPRSSEADNRYTNPDNDHRGVWSSSDLTARNYYGDGQYEVTSPSGDLFRPTMGTYWRISKQKFEEMDKDGRIWWGREGNNMPRQKRFLSEVKQGIVPQTVWRYEDVGHTQDAKRELLSIVPYKRTEDVLNTVKPTKLISRICNVTDNPSKNGLIVDFFAGSGSTAHGIIRTNHEDGGFRKFFIIEVSDYFEAVTLLRVKRAAYAPMWKDGRPQELTKRGYAFKYIRLESYEDALENLALAERPKDLEDLFSAKDREAGPGRMSELRIRYMLSRMLATEAKGASLLDIEEFRDPTGYTLTVLRDGVETPVRVDLVETFSWLIGMTVKKLHAPRRYRSAFVRDPRHGRLVWPRRANGRIDRDAFRTDPEGAHWFRLVEGTLPGGEAAVVIWRSLTGDAETDNLALDAFAEAARLNARDSEVRVVWVNGDNNLQNLRLAAPEGDQDEDGEDGAAPPIAMKVRLIEEDFQRLMFADTDTSGIL
ncbi:site-specific DNA-methyltransferase [Azospirillum thermophilum]|uniref:site-specific DNA-methyltransferase (adenine-specific) n=1 Tax=Azospirillum thermophilum TaxID=2202148 RepID=A0A2S2CLR7_9PROT|nr:site-specific DNA-methyltransferase [Azospirillum thermophilum]AWK85406.1 site-specific DNA-methyltransferase [Azospirillum thermophilum]